VSSGIHFPRSVKNPHGDKGGMRRVLPSDPHYLRALCRLLVTDFISTGYPSPGACRDMVQGAAPPGLL
jgi:hypothetical protein